MAGTGPAAIRRRRHHRRADGVAVTRLKDGTAEAAGIARLLVVVLLLAAGGIIRLLAAVSLLVVAAIVRRRVAAVSRKAGRRLVNGLQVEAASPISRRRPISACIAINHGLLLAAPLNLRCTAHLWSMRGWSGEQL